ncbi:transglutaminase-like cysteine peptidase [Brevundimonas sp.]|uniref:transglutaminase-like cysteine peptidase n=1 Tax=Brevundimonas sp. TaxID=1871086 RepID=UPI002617D2F6|nr:transglutaminase-like cysteine peptidase [Brevundimonas sp.]
MILHIHGRLALLSLVLLCLTSGSAWAADGVPDPMALGPTASAPTGFIEMCERTPSECLAVTRPTDSLLSEVRTWAARARWNAVFETAGLASATAAGPASTVAPPVGPVTGMDPVVVAGPGRSTAGWGQLKPTPQDIRRLKDDRRKYRRGPLSKTLPRDTPAAVPMAPSLPVADVTVQRLETVTRRVNRAIRRAPDAVAYGQADVWVSPRGHGAVGDCEDYVLAKRRLLIEEGVDPAALSIAIVLTRAGERHAVLLVATPEGERVLDNLSPWVLRWNEAPYEWLERQAPGQPLVWVQAATRAS